MDKQVATSSEKQRKKTLNKKDRNEAIDSIKFINMSLMMNEIEMQLLNYVQQGK